MANEGPKNQKSKTPLIIGAGSVIGVGGLGLVADLYPTLGRVNETVTETVKKIVKGDDDDSTPNSGTSGYYEGGEPAELNFDEMVIAVLAIVVVAGLVWARSGSRAPAPVQA